MFCDMSYSDSNLNKKPLRPGYEQEVSKNKTYFFFLFFILVPLFYSFYTNNIWEDFFITFRFSQNLVEGKGLVYNPGTRVYGFTSPIQVLLLALSYLITAKSSYLLSIWIFRIISITAFAVGGILLIKSLPYYRKNVFSVFLACLYAFESKSVAFSTNGMETAFLLFFVSWFLFLSVNDISKNCLMGGICWTGLMYTRIDGGIYIFVLFLVGLMLSDSFKRYMGTAFKMLYLCVLFYLPWFLGTWLYYGSPLPNTVKAKAVYIKFAPLLAYERFGPIYGDFGGWPFWIIMIYITIGCISSLYCFFPHKDKLGRAVSFGLFLLFLYLYFAPRYPWYFPPLSLLSSYVITVFFLKFIEKEKNERSMNSPQTNKARGPILGLSRTTFFSSGMPNNSACRYFGIQLEAVKNAVSKVGINKIIAFTLMTALCMFQLLVFLLTAMQMKIQQKEIEDAHRKNIGLWLKENCKSQETVFTESLGYIGFFSQTKMLDYPGLVTPEVTRLSISDKRTCFFEILRVLKPDWLVLRPYEVEMLFPSRLFQENYMYSKTFDARSKLMRYSYIPGKGYLMYDSIFLIFKRKSDK